MKNRKYPLGHHSSIHDICCITQIFICKSFLKQYNLGWGELAETKGWSSVFHPCPHCITLALHGDTPKVQERMCDTVSLCLGTVSLIVRICVFQGVVFLLLSTSNSF